MRRRLIMFTRFPEPGTTKTRLISSLGPEGAADLQRKMSEYTLSYAKKARESNNLHLEIRYDGGNEQLMTEWLGADLLYSNQGDGDLGTRMAKAFSNSFDCGMDQTVIVGTDCPRLTHDVMKEAFLRLEQHDTVLGPAKDGGYYLIGLSRMVPELFEGVSWGTENVLRETLAIAENAGVSVACLDLLGDIDRPEDLSVDDLKSHSRSLSPLPLISVIIPALDEAADIGQTLDSIKTGTGVEVIVVDGGSSDETKRIAGARGAAILSSSQGLARQMNAGAKAASGEILLFLHADTHLPDGYDRHVRRIVDQPGTSAGAFKLTIDGCGFKFRLIEWLAHFRSRYFQTPYGDQAIFLKKTVFQEVGGFPAIPIMADFELVRNLRRIGHVVTATAPVMTSGRRWKTLGVWRTTLVNQMMIAGYYLGIPPERLAGLYCGQRD